MPTYGDLDPYYKQKQLDRLGEGLGLFLQIKQQKEQQKDRERQEALSRFWKLSQEMPEAAIQASPDILRRYGDQVPELAGMVSWLKNRKAVQQKIDEAGQRYLSYADQLAQRDMARQASPGQPLAGVGPYAPSSPIASAPSAATAPGQPVADVAFVEAARALSPSERQAAELYAKQRGVPFPSRFDPAPFDPYGGDLTAKGKGMLAREQGLLPPGTAEQQLIESNMKVGARERFRQELESRRGERYNRSLDIQERGISLREQERAAEEPGEPKTKPLSPSEKRQRFQDLTSSIARTTATLNKEDDDLPPLTDNLSRRLAKMAQELAKKAAERNPESGLDEASLADEAAGRLLEHYQKWIALGLSRERAVAMILRREIPPEPGASEPLRR